ncbi:FAD-dependent oxidoreductase [Corallococcus llansteffanensis]|nr:FAD-dependent oxidoreductase [Corallococcus llansteffanensis]
MHFDFAVVGNGLLGAAVLHALSQESRRVVGFGAPYGAQARYYSSHEDDSRLVRTHHDDAYWEELTTRNLQLLRQVEEATGVTVFRPLPVYYRRGSSAAPPGSSLRAVATGPGRAHDLFDAEDVHGGIVHPKEYIRALNALAVSRGARLHAAAVDRVVREGEGYRLVPHDGDSVTADVVISTRGAFSEEAPGTSGATLVGKVLIYCAAPRGAEQGAYCFIDSRPGASVFKDRYGFVQYRSEGREALSKFGFTEARYWRLRDPEDLRRWFQGGYQDYPYLREALGCIEDFTGGGHRVVDIKPCAFTVTPDGKPLIRREHNHITMTGCNGSLAKCNQAFAHDALAQLGLGTAAGKAFH